MKGIGEKSGKLEVKVRIIRSAFTREKESLCLGYNLDFGFETEIKYKK